MDTAITPDDAIPEAQSDKSSYFKIIWNTFFAPFKAFKALEHKPRWLIPYIISIVVVFTSLALTGGTKMEDIKADLRSDPSLTQPEVERRIANIDAQKTQGISWAHIRLGVVAVTVIQTIKLFGLALIFWLALHLVKTSISFKKTLAVCSFAFLILIPEALIKIPLILVKGTTYIYLGPAILLPGEWKYSPLFNLFEKLDVFSIWMAIILIIGFSVLLNISRRKSAITVGYLWGIWLLIGMFFGNLIQIN
nr:YIP1 family protein [candidate division Zixibacteria bacterium]